MQWPYFFEDTPHTISFRLPYGPYHLSASKKEVINLDKSHDLVWPCLMTSERKLIELHPETHFPCQRQRPVNCTSQQNPKKRRKMREVISIHVGQAGIQIGNACCERSFSLNLSRAYHL